MELYELTLRELQQVLHKGRHLPPISLNRCWGVSMRWRKIKAFITLDEEGAINQAQQCDARGLFWPGWNTLWFERPHMFPGDEDYLCLQDVGEFCAFL